MSGAEGRRYRAFISYSHKDKATGNKLFRRLDGYCPPKKLWGRETPLGPVPTKLYPIFRDREELTAGGQLSERIRAALAASDHLVVLCSPNAAASRYVNEEVSGFQELGKTERIHAVLLDGEPAAALPPALTAAVGEPLAADLRKSGDGWIDGPLKLISGLLGLPFGELKDREVARARFRARVYAAIAGLFAVLAMVAVLQRNRAEAVILTAVQGVGGIVDRVVAGADRGEITVSVADGLLQTAQTLVAGIVAQAPNNRQLKAQEARLNLVLAQHYRRAGKLKLSLRAADRAERIFQDLAASGDDMALRNRSVALGDQGNALLAEGDLGGALEAYAKSLDIAKRLAALHRGNTEWGRNVSVGLSRVGDGRKALGDSAGALEAYAESLEIRRRLAASDPGNAELARDVSVSLSKMGHVRAAQGDLGGALEVYAESLEILRRLAASDPGDAVLARDVSASLDGIGIVRVEEGDRAGALTAYAESLEIVRRLAASDPGNAGWAYDVSVSLERIGDVRKAEGDRAGALKVYAESLEIVRRLAASDPGNGEWARHLVVSNVKLVEVADDPTVVREHYAAALAMVEDLARSGRLAPADTWMIDDLKARLAAAGGR